MIQRQLEEVGEKQRDLEERGVAIEKIIRGETGTKWCIYTHTHTRISDSFWAWTRHYKATFNYRTLHYNTLVQATIHLSGIPLWKPWIFFYSFFCQCPFRKKNALPCNPGLVKSLYIQLMVVFTMDSERLYCCFIFLQYIALFVFQWFVRTCQVDVKQMPSVCVCVFVVWFHYVLYFSRNGWVMVFVLSHLSCLFCPLTTLLHSSLSYESSPISTSLHPLILLQIHLRQTVMRPSSISLGLN